MLLKAEIYMEKKSMNFFNIAPEGHCEINKIIYPAIGFGTYPLRDNICELAVLNAIDAGYRIIDTATYYKNFIPIGNALKTSTRQEYYIISKVWPDSQTADGIKKDIQLTLSQLKTDYLDAYLLHWPFNQIPIEESLITMQQLQSEGFIRHIGMSNVSVNHLIRALEVNIPISWVQIEMNPQFCDFHLLDFCRDNNIGIQAWGPLGRGRLNTNPLLAAIGKWHNKTAAQVSLKWILQHGCLALPGSKNISHMRENMKINDFMLSEDEMKKIDEMAKTGQRERIVPEWNLGFTDEFDFPYSECWPLKKI
jgi:diketogulonate reductase-like aldo/keto reductase